ncbi:MAG: hypothetical protein VW228_03480, partial [Pelagibacteraceae bacterium]
DMWFSSIKEGFDSPRDRHIMIEYTLFLFANLWSYFFIKLKKNFSKKTNIIFSLFVAKISYFTLASSIFFGIFNFGLQNSFLGLILSIIFIEIFFFVGKKYLNQKNNLLEKVQKFKSYFEYGLIAFFLIYLINKFY